MGWWHWINHAMKFDCVARCLIKSDNLSSSCWMTGCAAFSTAAPPRTPSYFFMFRTMWSHSCLHHLLYLSASECWNSHCTHFLHFSFSSQRHWGFTPLVLLGHQHFNRCTMGLSDDISVHTDVISTCEQEEKCWCVKFFYFSKMFVGKNIYYGSEWFRVLLWSVTGLRSSDTKSNTNYIWEMQKIYH